MGHACRYKYPSIFVGAQVQTPKVISLSPGIVKQYTASDGKVARNYRSGIIRHDAAKSVQICFIRPQCILVCWMLHEQKAGVCNQQQHGLNSQHISLIQAFHLAPHVSFSIYFMPNLLLLNILRRSCDATV